MAKPKTCKLCGVRPAAVPDRNKTNGRIEVCRECHAERLRADLGYIITSRPIAGRLGDAESTDGQA